MPDTKQKAYGPAAKKSDLLASTPEDSFLVDSPDDTEDSKTWTFAGFSLMVWLVGFATLATFALYDLITALLFR